MQLIVFCTSVKFHQNIPYSNRANGQNSCFIYGRLDSSYRLFTHLPVIWHLIHPAAVWIYTMAVSKAFDGSRQVFPLFLFASQKIFTSYLQQRKYLGEYSFLAPKLVGAQRNGFWLLFLQQNLSSWYSLPLPLQFCSFCTKTSLVVPNETASLKPFQLVPMVRIHFSAKIPKFFLNYYHLPCYGQI